MLITQNNYARTPYGNKDYEWEKKVSRRLHQPIIEYGVSDTCGSIGYTLFDDGELLEDFFAYDQGSRPDLERSWFTSTRRQVRLERMENIYEFVHQFLAEQDAFDPAISFDYFFDYNPPRGGEQGTVINPGFFIVSYEEGVRTPPGIELVDYLVLKSSR